MAGPVIYLVDDDAGIRLATHELLKLRGYHSKLYASGQQLLDDFPLSDLGCLIVDFKMPEMSGLQLIREIRARGSTIPFLIITGCATIAMAVEAMRLGAVNIIEKPFDPSEFLDTVTATVAESELAAHRHAGSEGLDDPRKLLTPRETQVLGLVVQGHLTKNIAKMLNISSKTVEVHRSNITKKFKVDSVAQLIGKVLTLDPQFLARQNNQTATARH